MSFAAAGKQINYLNIHLNVQSHYSPIVMSCSQCLFCPPLYQWMRGDH
jgi:hypothetical protein